MIDKNITLSVTMTKKGVIKLFALILFAAIIGVALRYGYNQGYIRMNYPGFDTYPVHGIDVSHHQGYIDWSKFDEETVQFAFIKASEGVDHKDSLFRVNRILANRNNIVIGAYHYFSFCREGEEQAQNYIETISVDSSEVLPIVDLEYGGNCMKENRLPNLIEEIEQYIDIVEAHFKKKVIIYSTNEFYKNYLQGQFLANPIWIRDILSTPNLPDNRKWTFWQFTNRGRLDGVNSTVDLNVFNGSKEEFKSFCREGVKR